MNVVLYTTGCPKCVILEKKMAQKGIEYTQETDVDLMTEKGFMSLPMLEVDGNVMDFGAAVRWLNEEN